MSILDRRQFLLFLLLLPPSWLWFLCGLELAWNGVLGFFQSVNSIHQLIKLFFHWRHFDWKIWRNKWTPLFSSLSIYCIYFKTKQFKFCTVSEKHFEAFKKKGKLIKNFSFLLIVKKLLRNTKIISVGGVLENSHQKYFFLINIKKI